MGTATQRWTVGGLTITCVVEDQFDHVPPEFFLPEATAEAVRAHEWVTPDWADDDGNIGLRVQAFVVEGDGRTVLVDPCVGNGKNREFPFWHEQEWPFMDRFAAAGYTADGVDLVVHTHLHVDHIGWDTHLEAGAWVPTFTRARHVYTEAELDWFRGVELPDFVEGNADSVQPVFDAGLADVVADDTDLDGGLRLEPTPGHTPGHVSLWVESEGETALLTGDFIHHPVQCAEPGWAEIGDAAADEARTTRREMLARLADSGALVLGTHFPEHPGGRVVADGDVWRFAREPGGPVGD